MWVWDVVLVFCIGFLKCDHSVCTCSAWSVAYLQICLLPISSPLIHTLPHRTSESARLVSPRHQSLNILGLGGSVGTGPEGITADVVVVSDFEGLAAMTREAVGWVVYLVF